MFPHAELNLPLKYARLTTLGCLIVENLGRKGQVENAWKKTGTKSEGNERVRTMVELLQHDKMEYETQSWLTQSEHDWIRGHIILIM